MKTTHYIRMNIAAWMLLAFLGFISPSSVLKHSCEILRRQDAMAARGWGVRVFHFGGFADVSRVRKAA